MTAGTHPRFGIQRKLTAIIVVATLAIVGFLAVYFPLRQVRDLRAALERTARTYGRVISKQMEPAIAFDDRETARELTASVAADADVAAVTLHRSRGTVLHSYGSTSALDLSSVRDIRLHDVPGRLVVMAPVVSIEGPRGTLVIELSTRRLDTASARVIAGAAVAAACALAFGVIAAWLISRSLARRLAAMARVASAVAAGDLEQEPIEDRSTDEIGALNRAFRAMLAQIKGLFANIQAMAREEQTRLAKLVRERTSELNRRNEDLRMVLDNVDQGFVTVGLDGRMSDERSAAVERLLGPAARAGSLIDAVAAIAPADAPMFEFGWQGLREDDVPMELRLSQLPDRLVAGDRHLGFEYKPLHRDAGRILVIITDLTSRMARERAERDEREATALLSRLLADRAGLLEFLAEADVLVAEIAAQGGRPTDQDRRRIHTFKGLAGAFGLPSLSELCHELEELFDEAGAPQGDLRRRIAERWAAVRGKFTAITPEASGGIEISQDDYRAALAALDGGASAAQLRELLASWQLEPARTRLDRLADQARDLASSLEKGPVQVVVEETRLRLPGQRWAGVWSALIHAVRNAVDHGVEPIPARLAAGKPAMARITLRAIRERDVVAVELQDDGPGIDWSGVVDAARALSSSGAPIDVNEALYLDGVSTRCVATAVSGRGVGMSALRDACRATGGEVSVTSNRNGTNVRCSWPAPAINGEATRERAPLKVVR